MAKRRIRDIKKGEIASSHPKKKKKEDITLPYASPWEKIKAFLTDSFMLLMPILYAVIYLAMGGREGFAEDRIAGWLYILLPLIVIQTLFMHISGQTPGYRAYNLEVVDAHTGRRPHLFLIIFRNTTAILSAATLFGWMLMFFRKDHQNLHDLLSGTVVIRKP